MARKSGVEGTEEKLHSIIKARDDHLSQVLKANERLRETNDGLRDEMEELKEMVEILRARGKSEDPGGVTEQGGVVMD
jgi:hypothetical protein